MNKILILKGKKSKTYNGIKTQLDLAFNKLFEAKDEDYKDNIAFYEDKEDDKTYTWTFSLPNDDNKIYLEYNKNTGEIYKY